MHARSFWFFSAAKDSASLDSLCGPFATDLILPYVRAGASHVSLSGENETDLPVVLLARGAEVIFCERWHQIVLRARKHVDESFKTHTAGFRDHASGVCRPEGALPCRRERRQEFLSTSIAVSHLSTHSVQPFASPTHVHPFVFAFKRPCPVLTICLPNVSSSSHCRPTDRRCIL